MKIKAMIQLIVLGGITIVTSNVAQDVNSYIELLRSDVNTEKKAIINEVMVFSDSESEIFWKIYNKYEYELGKVGDARVSLIKDYADNYYNMTDEKAAEIMDNAFSFQEDRLDLKKDLWKKLMKNLNPAKAAKFIQLENQIQLIIDLQINSELPLIERTAKKSETNNK